MSKVDRSLISYHIDHHKKLLGKDLINISLWRILINIFSIKENLEFHYAISSENKTTAQMLATISDILS